MTNDDIANSEQGEDLENRRTKYKIFQSIICNFFFLQIHVYLEIGPQI